MYLEYSRPSHPNGGYNFGDDLNPWLFPRLVPEIFEDSEDGMAFIGIGTILDQRRVERELLENNKANVIFSSGAGFSAPPKLDSKWHVYCVRGPHTARALGLDNNVVVADGAYLLRDIVDINAEKTIKVSFIPHHGSEDFVDWQALCDRLGINYLNPKQPVDSFLSELLASESVITEAMHGAIVADALRIPWTPVAFSPKFMFEKWSDFTQALSIDLNVQKLPFVTQNALSLGKTIDFSMKRGLSKLGLGPNKWKRLPNNYRKSSAPKMEELFDQLSALVASPVHHLSDESKVIEVTDQLRSQLYKLRDDYLSGKFTE